MFASEACFELMLPMYDVDVRTVPGVDASGEAVSSFNMSRLHCACQSGHLPMCKVLLSRGADRMARDSREWTPLHWAVRNWHLSCVVMLVGQPGRVRMTSAEVDAVIERGWTALHCAAHCGFDQICAVLIGAGARLDAETSDDLTPLMLAQHNYPTNAALLELLSGDGPAQPPGLACDHSGKTAEETSGKGLRLCGQCYVVRYCGKVCQLAAWPEHKAACKARAAEREEFTRTRVTQRTNST